MSMAGEPRGEGGIVTIVPIPAECLTMLGMPGAAPTAAPRPGQATQRPKIIKRGAPDTNNGVTSTEQQLLQSTT